jgi:hypothetical protein
MKIKQSRKVLILLAVLFIVLFVGLWDIYDKDKNQGTDTDPEVETKTEELQAGFYRGPLPEHIKRKINGVSWLKEAPIKLEDLDYVTVLHWGFDNETHIGELVVHREVSRDIVEIFEELYNKKFPIEKIRLVDDYNADDNLSMRDNNTYSFCFRVTQNNPGNLSKHSFGTAIDINPIQNPYITDNEILPPKGEDYLDRQNLRPGMIVPGNDCYMAFKRRGWLWGGEWQTMKDYQHLFKPIF